MDKLIENFPQQLEEAIEIGINANIRKPKIKIKNIVLSGLGGSGIGGNLVQELTSNELTVPFSINKDYFLPNYADENTLVIISSYSGNTEETLNAMELALDRGCHIICVSSGGKVIEKARQHKLDYIEVPGGMPPRACLGYSFVQQLFILIKIDLLNGLFKDNLLKSVDMLKSKQSEIKKTAKELSDFLYNSCPVIYISAHMESVAIRFRQQINENSKMLCWHHVIPEMNHNELVGWRDKSENLAVVYFRNNDDFERIQKRVEINKKIIGQYTSRQMEVYSKGENLLEQSLYLIHLGDWVSYFLAEKRNRDAVEVDVIDFLKGELSKS